MTHVVVSRAGRLAGAPLLLGLAAAAVFVLPGLAAALEYDRDRIADGELWRLLTCHWTHWSAEHLLLDAAVLVALGLACSLHCARRWLGCVALSAVLIPAVVWLALPDMVCYRGLSGLDAALYALLASSLLGQEARAGRWPLALLPMAALLGLAAKIGYELVAGQAAFVNSAGAGFVPVPEAHAVGGMVGVAFGLLGGARGKTRPFPFVPQPEPDPVVVSVTDSGSFRGGGKSESLVACRSWTT